MVMSMTGYGLAKNDFFRVEIKSHNHRFFEMLLRLPPQFSALEHKVREYIKARIFRGRVQAIITYEAEEKDSFKIDQEAARRFILSLREVGSSLNLRDDLALGHLVPIIKEILQPIEYDLEGLWVYLREALDEAINKLLIMRAEEGKRLSYDILERVKEIRRLLDDIKAMAPEVVIEYKEKLSKRIDELLEGKEIERDRLNMEVAIFAERSDITEEIVRLSSHLEQTEETLRMDGPIGKRLDFLSQELNREMNAIASKAANIKIIQNVLSMRNELEKLREQIQNIE